MTPYPVSIPARHPPPRARAQLPPTDYCTIAGRAHTSSALFELRNYDWREIHEASLVPPSSYLELTQIRAVGRYSRQHKDTWSDLGSVRYHPSGDEFHCRWYDDRQTVLLCAFDTTDAAGFDINIKKNHLSKTHDIRNSQLLNLLTRAQQEVEDPGLVSEVLLDALGGAILSEWRNQFIDILDTPSQRMRGEQLSHTELRNIVTRIREQRCAPTIADLASEQGVSTRHFNRLFRQTAGESIADVFKRERINRARDLLANPALLVKEIAYLCGFDSSAAFCKSFRSSMGISPQQFRLLYRK
tara:strand:+ start:45376 stop:46275 length:900 start_codon:yes stop_codon:yes gene_type:complete